ncbi:MAG: isochorismatase family protein, partial [Anaerolineae bacterium]|nr:isochorismatase family protein [Anaerolineae bacterium]
VNIHASVEPLLSETIIQKHFPNSFRQTTLLDSLQQLNIKSLVIAGMMTHMCIDATTRAAFDLGYECTVAGDACATRALKFKDNTVPALHVHHAFLAALQSTYAQVLTVNEILAER